MKGGKDGGKEGGREGGRGVNPTERLHVHSAFTPFSFTPFPLSFPLLPLSSPSSPLSFPPLRLKVMLPPFVGKICCMALH